MKSRARLLCSLLMLIWSMHTGCARDTDLRASQEQHKSEGNGGEVRASDESKGTREALEQQYAAAAQAYYDDDPNAVLSLRAPGFSALLPSGERLTSEESAAYVRAGFDQVERTLHASFDIVALTVRGDTAMATIHQRWRRLQNKAGRLRTVETEALQREWWLSTSSGWRLFLVDEVRPGVWKVDGKRVDPSKPFDPDAPAFDPESGKTPQRGAAQRGPGRAIRGRRFRAVRMCTILRLADRGGWKRLISHRATPGWPPRSTPRERVPPSPCLLHELRDRPREPGARSRRCAPAGPHSTMNVVRSTPVLPVAGS